MIAGVHHVQITIPPGSEDQARAFYCDLLGLVEIEKPDPLAGRGGLWLMVGDQRFISGRKMAWIEARRKRTWRMKSPT